MSPDPAALVDLAARFEQHRQRLFALAYRLLGEVGRAEDMVQESWLRLASTRVEPENLGGWLTTVTSRLCLDELRSARSHRESYVGPWLPEPLIAAPSGDDPGQLVEQAEDVSMAMLLVLESLSPLERVVFVLREVFGYEHAELAAMLGKSPEAVRQLAHRAREHVSARRPRFDLDDARRQEVLERFAAAAAGGDVEALAATLGEDSVLLSDSGGLTAAARRPVLGPQKIARFLIGLMPRYLTDQYRWQFGVVNGAPGILLWNGDELNTVMGFDVSDGHVARIHVQRNPEKLRRVHAAPPPS